MAKLTYAQVRSTASALVRKHHFETGGRVEVLIYKDAGGDFKHVALQNGLTIVYTSIKGIVYLDTMGNIRTDVSRETISNRLQDYSISFIYAKFG